MISQEAAAQPDKPEKVPGVFKKARNKVRDRWYCTKFFRWLEPTYTYKFAIGLKHDNFFWSRFNGAFNGGILIAEAWAGLHFLPKHIPRLLTLAHVAAIPAAPLIAHVVVIAGCAALAGIGLCAVSYGLVNAWKSMEGLCSKIFPKFNPPKRARIRVQKIVRGISAIPPVRILGNGMKKVANKAAQRPLAQKFLKSRLGRIARGPTQNQQDAFLAGVTIEGSTAFAIGLPAVVAVHVAALPAIATVGGLAALAAVAAVTTWEVVDCTLSVTSSIKTLAHLRRARKDAKKSAVGSVPVAPPAQEAGGLAVPANANTPAFNQAACAEGTAAETPARASVRSRRFGIGRSS